MPCYVDAYVYRLELSLHAYVLYHFIIFLLKQIANSKMSYGRVVLWRDHDVWK